MSTRERQHALVEEYNTLAGTNEREKKTLAPAAFKANQARMREITDYFTDNGVGFHDVVLGKGARGIALDRNAEEQAVYEAQLRQRRVEARYERLGRNVGEYRMRLEQLLRYAQEELALLDSVAPGLDTARPSAETLNELWRVKADQWSSSASLGAAQLSATIKTQVEDMLALDHDKYM